MGTDLIDEVLAMVVGQRLCPDDPVQICLHELLYEVYFAEFMDIGGAEDVEDGDDVFVVKVAEELDLAEGAQAKHGVVEGRDALDGHLAARWDVRR